MSSLTEQSMRAFLSRSISSLNRNKLNGLLAEVDFRTHLNAIGFGGRVSRGGWIARRIGAGNFAHNTAVFFPETIAPGADYPLNRELPAPDHGLHTICSTFHQTGISAFFCAGVIEANNDAQSLRWKAVQLGLPVEQDYQPFPDCVTAIFSGRNRRYNNLRYHSVVDEIPAIAVPEEFSKEHLRVAFNNPLMAEISDVDGIFWGQRFTYPLEIKEKTPANDARLGEYFGLDVGPFVKLAHYAARQGNLHSLFVVREINNEDERALVAWRFITFEQLARFASWVPRAGGTSMGGGRSSVVCIPRCEFQELNAANLAAL
jgi:hypothetical protein